MLSSDKPIDCNFGVIAIVGMGGLGKTTLAWEVDNDKELKRLKFEKKAWISISNNFDIMRTSKSVLESINHSFSGLNSSNKVQDKLKEEIRGRKFLLVLDLVWNENYSLWETFKSSFKDCARGSKIIVTTRFEKVALTMRSFETHKLNGLLDEECWNLFLEHAPSIGMDIDALGKFRESVVKKCGGLPLAAKTLDGLLHYEQRVNAWENILNSKLWDSSSRNDILPVLRLSYLHLPPHLKRCFAHCAVFPKDYEIDEKKLELLWLGEDIIQQSRDLSSLSNVTILKLENCNNCGSFPSLWMLSSLKDLTIEGMKRLEKIDVEMPLKPLEVLRFQNLQEWQCWNTKRENEDVETFPLLRELSIVKCPKLTRALPYCLPSLERLFIQKCSELTASIPSVPSLCRLEINDCKEVVCRSTISTEFQ
ncbi:putative disease resistance RPP13-like protein 1 [Pistacia vera]|uniref:putative disease resistance RPP13-like protein 1 n=1 Tax=Pistacia vera TaxID=55513 RepID=UPI001263586C|nr:putative disease resistance RPP13-like protein 1 [Pistacia vera]